MSIFDDVMLMFAPPMVAADPEELAKDERGQMPISATVRNVAKAKAKRRGRSRVMLAVLLFFLVGGCLSCGFVANNWQALSGAAAGAGQRAAAATAAPARATPTVPPTYQGVTLDSGVTIRFIAAPTPTE